MMILGDWLGEEVAEGRLDWPLQEERLPRNRRPCGLSLSNMRARWSSREKSFLVFGRAAQVELIHDKSNE